MVMTEEGSLPVSNVSFEFAHLAWDGLPADPPSVVTGTFSRP
jgi:hypothetical protein